MFFAKIKAGPFSRTSERSALRSALSDRAAEGKVIVVDAWNFETPKTKGAVAALAAIGATASADCTEVLILSGANIDPARHAAIVGGGP